MVQQFIDNFQSNEACFNLRSASKQHGEESPETSEYGIASERLPGQDR